MEVIVRHAVITPAPGFGGARYLLCHFFQSFSFAQSLYCFLFINFTYVCIVRARVCVCVHIQIIYIFIYISISICRHIGSRVDVSYFYVIHSLYNPLLFRHVYDNDLCICLFDSPFFASAFSLF